MKNRNEKSAAYAADVLDLLQDQLITHIDFHKIENTEVVKGTPLSCGLVPDLQVRSMRDNKEGKLAIQFSTTQDVGINDVKNREIKLSCRSIETFIYDYEKGEWVGNSYSSFLDADLRKLNSTE